MSKKQLIALLLGVMTIAGVVALAALSKKTFGGESVSSSQSQEIVPMFPSNPAPLYEGEVELSFIGKSTANFEYEMERVVMDEDPTLEEAKKIFCTWAVSEDEDIQKYFELKSEITFPNIDYDMSNVLISYGRKLEKFECTDTRSHAGAHPEAGYKSEGHAYMGTEYYPETVFIYTIPKIPIYNPVDYLMAVQDTYTIVDKEEISE